MRQCFEHATFNISFNFLEALPLPPQKWAAHDPRKVSERPFAEINMRPGIGSLSV